MINVNWKRTLAGLSMVALMAGSALAQEPAPADGGPPPPPPPGHRQWHGRRAQPHRVQLTDDQKAQLKALHEHFEAQRKADMHTFEAQFKSILNPQQLALVQKREDARKAREDAFKKGEAEARQKLEKSGQPVPKAGDHRGAQEEGNVTWQQNGPGNHFLFIRRDGPPDGGPFFGGPGPEMAFGGPGGEHRWGGQEHGRERGKEHGHGHGHHHHDGLLGKLKLTPEQMGEVAMFRQSMMEKQHTEMQAMMQQVKAIMPPPPPPSDQTPPQPTNPAPNQ